VTLVLSSGGKIIQDQDEQDERGTEGQHGDALPETSTFDHVTSSRPSPPRLASHFSLTSPSHSFYSCHMPHFQRASIHLHCFTIDPYSPRYQVPPLVTPQIFRLKTRRSPKHCWPMPQVLTTSKSPTTLHIECTVHSPRKPRDPWLSCVSFPPHPPSFVMIIYCSFSRVRHTRILYCIPASLPDQSKIQKPSHKISATRRNRRIGAVSPEERLIFICTSFYRCPPKYLSAYPMPSQNPFYFRL